jgi:membrane protein DedA with SNARE-associated domain
MDEGTLGAMVGGFISFWIGWYWRGRAEKRRRGE